MSMHLCVNVHVCVCTCMNGQASIIMRASYIYVNLGYVHHMHMLT